ncbi:MAG TPA: HEAT repeat domain-containing protein [Gemmataceae bacterium]|nr:HEAT repeat domain-containing protein [Gemmataceae bacterium]
MKHRVALVLLLTPVLAAAAAAGVFFNNKKPDKPNPADRVPELIKIIGSDGDEDKRMAAAAELRDYDAAQFPEITPALIDALLNDKKPGVRAEAAQSLGKIRPVSDPVGEALEESLAKDTSMRVRLQARTALLQYRWSGWKEPAPKKDDIPTARPKDPPPVQSQEPPLAPNIPPAPPRSKAQPAPAGGPDLNPPPP